MILLVVALVLVMFGSEGDGGLLMVVRAPVRLGVFGSMATLINGFVVGYIGAVFFDFSRLGFFVCGIAPHGVIELPALVLAAAFALRVGASMVRPSPGGGWAGMRLGLADYLIGGLLFGPMFALAALIEAYVTPAVLRSC